MIMRHLYLMYCDLYLKVITSIISFILPLFFLLILKVLESLIFDDCYSIIDLNTEVINTETVGLAQKVYKELIINFKIIRMVDIIIIIMGK